MKAITIAHTWRYHYRHNTSGHVWEGRFRSSIVSDDEYLLALMRYIEQNPVRAGIAKHPEEYPFSSYQANVTFERDALVDKEENPVFLGLGNTTQEMIEHYQKFTSSLLKENKLDLIRKSLGGQAHFISQEFLLQIKEKLLINQKKPKGRPRRNNYLATR